MWSPGCWQVIEGGRPGGQCNQSGGHQNEGIGRQGNQDDNFFHSSNIVIFSFF